MENLDEIQELYQAGKIDIATAINRAFIYGAGRGKAQVTRYRDIIAGIKAVANNPKIKGTTRLDEILEVLNNLDEGE